MIEKFNFYDVYGYFLPGMALIAVLWLPFGLATHVWPKADWGSALLTVVLAYFLGHLVLYVSNRVVPSYDERKSVDKERYPSATLLDADNHEFSKELREKIASAVRREFKWELHLDNFTGAYDGIRNDAFFLARERLIHDKAASYAEQFEGMYSLTRGLIVSLAVAAANYAGWVVSALRSAQVLIGAYVVAFLCVLLLLNLAIWLHWEEDQRPARAEARRDLDEDERKRLNAADRKRERWLQRAFAGAALVAFLAGGYALGCGYDISARTSAWLALAAAAAPVFVVRCYMQYKYFTVQFAKTVWRDFATCIPVTEAPKSARRYSSNL